MKIARVAVPVLLGISALILLAVAVESLRWRYLHDAPLMIYAGFLIDQGAVPYRDFFDMNMPGTYFVMWTMGRLFGWTDLASRIFDLSLLAILSLATFGWMRPFGRWSAAFAAIAFPLQYLAMGDQVSLQREFIALVPLALALALACRGAGRLRPVVRGFLVGAFCAAALLIKPQLILLALPVIVFLIQDARGEASLPRMAAAVLAGLSLPCGATLLYLIVTGSLAPFLDIVMNYWPLYGSMTGDHQPIRGMDRTVYILRSWISDLQTPLLPAALLGTVVRSVDPAMRRRAGLVGALLVAAALYPALSGQFWEYHWIPFRYVALCAASLIVCPAATSAVLPAAFERKVLVSLLVPVVPVIVLLNLSLHEAGRLYRRVTQQEVQAPPKGGVPDEVCRFLRSHLQAGDTVQPLDWTGGAVHGMLLARTPLATRFIYDFHFYHHVESSPYIHRLRQEFMQELTGKKPRFILQVLEDKPWPEGADTTRSFPELEAYLARWYVVAQEGRTYRILEWRL